MKPLVIYHGNCADGFGAAWVIWKKNPDWEFYPGVYQQEPPDVTDRRIVLVDFSYKKDVLLKMLDKAESIRIIDHHKSAMQDVGHLDHPKLKVWFDMEQSGAMMAWGAFHDPEPPPPLLRHIEDRDLWRFDMPGTREIQAALFSYPYEFELWDKLMDPERLNVLMLEGRAIERKHHKDIKELVKVCMRLMTIDGVTVPVASLPYTMTSDAGHLMASEHTHHGWAACYWDTTETRVFSLCSIEDVDVSVIAEKFGGGGHKNEAGFAVPRDHELAKS